MSELLKCKIELSDKLNPVLVRLLRESIRSSYFAKVLCFVHGVVALYILIIVIIFPFYAIDVFPVLSGFIRLIMYLSCALFIRTLDSERFGDCLDHLLFIPNRARVIVYGYWQVGMYQALIMVCTFLPYTVLNLYSRSEEPYIGPQDMFGALAIACPLSAIVILNSAFSLIKRSSMNSLVQLVIVTHILLSLGFFVWLAGLTDSSVAIFISLLISSSLLTWMMLSLSIRLIRRFPLNQRRPKNLISIQ